MRVGLQAKVKRSKTFRRASALPSPWIDLIRALFILAFPLYVFFLACSFLNQLVRKLAHRLGCACGMCKRMASDDEASLCLTKVASDLNATIIDPHYAWAKALTYAQYIVLGFWAFKYGTILTNIGTLLRGGPPALFPGLR